MAPLLLVLLSVLPLAQADAAELLQSHPVAGTRLSAAPQEVRLWFDVEPMTPTTSLQILGPDNATTAVHSIHTMGEKDLMGFVVDDMAPGQYQLEWRVGDNHGVVPFSIAPAAN